MIPTAPAMSVMMEGDGSSFEITETLLETEILPRLLTFSTSLFAAKERTETDPIYCGSATFVATGGRRCLLTAEHVWRRVQHYGPCLLLTLDYSVSESRRHPLAVDLQLVGPARYITTRVSDEWGPDLALLHLPDRHAGKVLDAKAFYNLDGRREAALATAVSHKTGIWAVVGAPAEHCYDEPEGRVMKTYVFGSTIKQAKIRDGFDYLDFKIKGKTPRLLGSFGGVSGAGLWRCVLRRSPTGAVEYDHHALEGVAFYQKLDRQGRGFIRCHGRSSIYRHALEAGSRL